MPAPLAKGIMVTVTVLVAAGVAVYQSPQFQEWMNNSRRKIAVALHSLGDEIQPRRSASPTRDDISMTEEAGEAAERRRRIAREEILRRAAVLESHRSSQNSQKPLDSFDTLVEQDGNLRMQNKDGGQMNANPVASSSGVDRGDLQSRRRKKLSDIDTDQLHIDTAPETPPHHISESVLQFTPTSDGHGEILFDPFSDSPVRGQSPVSTSSSSHTEDNSVYYTHPHSESNASQQQPELIADLDDFSHGNQFQHDVSSAPSIAGSFSDIHELADQSSDGTLSDWAHSVGGVDTPTSWSEVGSVISEHDAGHQQLL
ncbi:hypothetical protein N7466_011032 [Penicillium verhagenii]|uniref:uncharacterized protein n=1 Tax=Penicillium verhagenii TaxID=1562060 RepID=UPI0025452E0A|nr:uncharacterized protein N7466_011032 [Penicillium verhagenii]KAJ5917478.1 hypothetical protein N7466_011032 [Penicillium verhagenii]